MAENGIALQVTQSEADSLRMELAESQTSIATLRSTLEETEGQVCAEYTSYTRKAETCVQSPHGNVKTA